MPMFQEVSHLTAQMLDLAIICAVGGIVVATLFTLVDRLIGR